MDENQAQQYPNVHKFEGKKKVFFSWKRTAPTPPPRPGVDDVALLATKESDDDLASLDYEQRSSGEQDVPLPLQHFKIPSILVTKLDHMAIEEGAAASCDQAMERLIPTSQYEEKPDHEYFKQAEDSFSFEAAKALGGVSIRTPRPSHSSAITSGGSILVPESPETVELLYLHPRIRHNAEELLPEQGDVPMCSRQTETDQE